MPKYRVPTSDGPVVIEAATPAEAKRRAAAGEGTVESASGTGGDPVARMATPESISDRVQTPGVEAVTNPQGAVTADPRLFRARQPQAQPSLLRSTMTALPGALAESAPAAALPTTLGIGGALAGGALSGGNPLGVMGGEAVGSATGEALNQLLGLTPRSGTAIAVTGALGPTARVLGGVGRQVGRQVARSAPETAIALQEEAVQTARGMGQAMIPQAKGLGTAAERALDSITMTVPAPKFQAMTQRLAATEQTLEHVAKGLDSASLGRLTEGILAGPVGGGLGPATMPPQLDFQAMRLVSKRLGQRIGSLEGGVVTDSATKEQLGAYRALFKSLQDDVDAAVAAAPGPSRLRQAHALYKRELAQDRLEELTKQAIQVQEGSGLEFVQGKRLLKGLQEDPIFQRALTKDEYRHLESAVKDLVKTPRLPPPEGTNAGSMRVLKAMGGGGSVGTAAGSMLGDPVLGGAIGTAAALGAPKLIAVLMLHPMGRKAVLNAAKGGFSLDAPHLARMAIATGAIGSAELRTGRDAQGATQ